MHKILEFQSVVLAAGRGSRLPDVGGTVSKCLLPVGPYPVLWYTLNMLERFGFQETMVVILSEDLSNIINALEKCPLKIKYELIVIPSDEDWGTADSLRHISSRVNTDILVVSGDLITNTNLNDLLNLHRKHDSALTTLFFNNGLEPWIELPGPKNKNKPDRDLVCIDKETQRLVFLASASDFEENVTIPRIIIKKYNDTTLYSRLLDAHVYVVKKWVINYLVESNKFTSVKGELIPHIIKKQLSKPKTTAEKKGMSEKNIEVSKDVLDYAQETGFESKIREMSSYNDHKLGSKSVYFDDVLRCYAHIAPKNTFGMRINTLSAFYLCNSMILSKWEELMGSTLEERFHPNSEVKTKQIDESCTVGEKSFISEKTSIKSTFIGPNCTIENKVRLTNCILMNNVTIKEGCVLQDCVIYTGATVDSGCSLQHCLVGPHHLVPASTASNHQLHAETTDNMITLG
ncbi:translation initiation factor eIF2B subunit gamma [Plodia interpunctella]|uniref:translation initiation factor eIF2B subunit gamma n=1 Tax=Plodia interpunctella TaxID=58824 RepID=UPI0023684038|nr:translation initiation factor eIF-2B subunit gamma [Plodia interpunctella]XP_053602854.1 translation initiation factor eIF-2B subunit gamma [Plodia interpunctella]XP_053602855.1 translation initiation factor eIF-2B subunit gamma [Plodia interpunctella]